MGAKIDAAQTTDENRKHWQHADGLSANAAYSPEVRRTLRNRSRYEVVNNSFAAGIVATLANDTIGTGPRLQLLTNDSDANRALEQDFHRWAKAVRLPAKLRTMRQARAVDGEYFAQLVTNPHVRHEVMLDLRLLEADQIATPTPNLVFDPNVVDGVRLDAGGNVIGYDVLQHHPGEDIAINPLAYTTVPAGLMLHGFWSNRPGQYRGVPELTPALPLFALLRRYTLAVLSAAETAADISAVMYTDSPALEDIDEVESMDAVELVRRAMLTLPAGWKVEQVKSEQPTTTYEMFRNAILNEIARCLNMPFNVAAGNSASYNYASGRMDHQVYHKSIFVVQSEIESDLDTVQEEWLKERLRTKEIDPADFPHAWFWDGQEHVDPQKEALAQQTRLESHTTTLAAEYARCGKDWETELRQRAKEIEMMRSLGMDDSEQKPERDLVEAIQKIYLGVGTILTPAEAREILNKNHGAALKLPGPPLGQGQQDGGNDAGAGTPRIRRAG